MKILVSEIVDRVNYDKKFKGKIQELQRTLLEYMFSHYDGSNRRRVLYTQKLNEIAYKVYCGDYIGEDFNAENFINTEYYFDAKEIESVLKSCYVDTYDIEWDIPIVDIAEELIESLNEVKDVNDSEIAENKTTETTTYSSKYVLTDFSNESIRESRLEDLWLKPRFPRFDLHNIWMEGIADGNHLVIYKSIPAVPSVQNDITVTTDVSDITDIDALNLYPSKRFNTRYPNMYVPVEGIYKHPVLGNILPIDGYDKKTLIDNVVKYPHFYKVQRMVNGRSVNFFKYIEIDGELKRTLDVWDSLPEASIIPRNIEFIKDYVIRRYLLERDVKGIKHNYPIVGELNPFITLFTTKEEYCSMGYTDLVSIARKCIDSRIAFYRSRNPIIRRLSSNV